MARDRPAARGAVEPLLAAGADAARGLEVLDDGPDSEQVLALLVEHDRPT